MKAIVMLMITMGANLPSWAATAYWTGRHEVAISVTRQYVRNCEYSYAGQKFWRAFKDSCPLQIEVE